MVAGLPKDPIGRARSIRLFIFHASQRGATCQTRSPNTPTDACLGEAIGGFSLRGEARSMST